MTAQSIKKRSEQKREDTWSIEDLYASDAEWQEAFAAISGREGELAAYQGRLAESGAALLAYFRDAEALSEEAERLYTYAMLRCDEDTRNSTYQGFRGRMMGWLVRFQQSAAFETPELVAIPDETLARFYEETPELTLYRRYLDRVRRRRAHTLSPAEEALLAAAGEMAQSPDDIYGSFVNADLTFPSVRDVEGNVHPLTNGTYITLMESPRPVIRRGAFKNLYQTYDKFKNTTAATLNAQVRQSIFFARARKYPTTLEAALDANEVPVSVYHSLIEAVHENMEPMYRYVALRKRVMGLDELHMYDLYTPMVPDCDRKIPFAQAKEEVLAAMSVLGPEYGQVLLSAFDDRWIDIYENEGKRSGAYSCGARVHPYVLMNYTDSLNSEFTVAHELGHSMHSYLSNKNQPPVYADYVIFVAEVASLCNESLLMQYLLGRTEDKKQRAYLINYFLEQFRTTLYRQTMFAEFEREIHRIAEAGETLTADRLNQIYYDLNCLYYGDGMVIDREIEVEWARIPHFYYNFYVYQYATGFAAAMAISRRILREGQPAVDDYLKFLGSGSSADPITLLRTAGVDMTTGEPVKEALAYFAELVGEMEELTR